MRTTTCRYPNLDMALSSIWEYENRGFSVSQIVPTGEGFVVVYERIPVDDLTDKEVMALMGEAE